MIVKLLSAACILLTAGAFFLFPNETTAPVTNTPPMDSVNDVTPAPDNPEELGKVHWLRDLDAGKAEAEKSGKPILILFQEVPGCSNCTRYGNNTLSHPLIVEAIETYFVPVCIYNNKGGKDAEALKRFDEPAWNNPVVRIMRADYSDVVLRMGDFRSSYQLVEGMRRALDLTGAVAPATSNCWKKNYSHARPDSKPPLFPCTAFGAAKARSGPFPASWRRNLASRTAARWCACNSTPLL
ncbi:MAG: thioredoxin family protein [Lewinellaceae bacterium]|nr:thioredoxin family protein [Lewinellaceae bacterium]